jgi:hypothetical protein
MKKGILVVAFVVAALAASTSPCAELFDDFEAYEANSAVRGQGEWTTWNDNTDPNVDTIVSDEQAFSGSKSLLLTNSCDMIHVYRTVTFGMWTVRAQVFVSSEQAGVTYFILCNTYNHGGPYSWSVQLAMDAAKQTLTSDMSGSQSVPLILDEWVELVVELDLDNNLHSIFYNDQEFVSNMPWQSGGKNAFECIDLYSLDNAGNKTFIDDLRVSTELCLPLEIERTFEGAPGVTTFIEGVETAAYKEGDVLSVTLNVTNVRGNRPGCPNLGNITVTETLPDGWTATEISNGGVFADGKIVWAIPAAQAAAGKITYKASGPVTRATLDIAGIIVEAGNALVVPIGGLPMPTVLGGLSADGMILSWLFLGPLQTTGSSTTTSAALMEQDFLTDGDTITEADVMPAAGDEVVTDFGGSSPSLGLAAIANADINPAGIPQWVAWRDRDVQISFDDTKLFGPVENGAVDNVMCYAVCYICAEDDMTVALSAGSDDSIQVLLGDQEVWIMPVERSWPGLADHFTIDLKKGVNRLMAKIFETGGGWNFGISLTDVDGNVITGGLIITLDPHACTPPAPTFKRGEVNADGQVNIADAIALLGHLFASQPAPVCRDAADANDDGTLNIADAIKILGHLFAQAGPLPAPFGACGPDPTPDALVECNYPEAKC